MKNNAKEEVFNIPDNLKDYFIGDTVSGNNMSVKKARMEALNKHDPEEKEKFEKMGGDEMYKFVSKINGIRNQIKSGKTRRSDSGLSNQFKSTFNKQNVGGSDKTSYSSSMSLTKARIIDNLK